MSDERKFKYIVIGYAVVEFIIIAFFIWRTV